MMIGGHPKTDHRNYSDRTVRGRPQKNRETAPARGPDADRKLSDHRRVARPPALRPPSPPPRSKARIQTGGSLSSSTVC